MIVDLGPCFWNKNLKNVGVSPPINSKCYIIYTNRGKWLKMLFSSEKLFLCPKASIGLLWKKRTKTLATKFSVSRKTFYFKMFPGSSNKLLKIHCVFHGPLTMKSIVTIQQVLWFLRCPHTHFCINKKTMIKHNIFPPQCYIAKESSHILIFFLHST